MLDSNLIEYIVEVLTANPACINWDYFLEFGFNGDGSELSQKIISLIKEEMPEDTGLYNRLLSIVGKVTNNNKDITYDFIVNVLEKFIISFAESIDEYLRVLNRFYNCTSYISPTLPCRGNDLESLDISVRAYNCLKYYGCITVDDVIAVINTDKLSEVRNLGKEGTENVIEAVEKWKEVNKWSDK